MHFRWLSILLLALTFGLSSCAEQAAMPGKAFEGTITQIIKVPGLAKLMSGDSGMGGGGALLGAASNVNVKIYAREDRVAYEMAVMGGLLKIKSIINRSTRTLTMLTPDKKAIVIDLKSMDSMRNEIDDSIRGNSGMIDSLADQIPKPTGKKMEINGFEVEEYVSRSNDMDIQMWVTEDPRMQFYEVVQDALLGRQRTGMGGMEEIFAMFQPISKGKIPVQVTAKLNGEVLATSEMTKLEQEELDDSVFEIPAGYEIVKQDASSMQEGSSKSSSQGSVKQDSVKRSITGAPIK